MSFGLTNFQGITGLHPNAEGHAISSILRYNRGMTTLLCRAYLFGPVRLTRADESLPLPGMAAARSLLAYLLVDGKPDYARLALAGTFWPDLPEPRARRCLTQAIWHIRRILPELIQADAGTIHVHPEMLWVDVAAFKALTQNSLALAPDPETPDRQQYIHNLRQAIHLYQADLLEGIYDDWALLERERLRETFLQALEMLTRLEKLSGRYEQALEPALRLAQADPLREAAHREVMRLQYALGRPEAALRQYDACRLALQTDLGIAPDPETEALAQEIRANVQPQTGKPTLPYLPPALSTLATEITLVGRDKERTELLAHIDALSAQLGGVVLLDGEAGVGKSRLVNQIASDAAWRGCQVLWGYSREAQSAAPFAPLTMAIQSSLTALRASQLARTTDRIWQQVLMAFFPELKIADPSLTPPPVLPPQPERTRLAEAFGHFLAGWGCITPLVIFIEDLQWAGADLLDLLSMLAGQLRDSSVLIIATLRGGEASLQSQTWEKLRALDRAGLRARITLPSLSAAQTAELIRRCLGMGGSAPLFEAHLFQETSGNPLFVIETLRSLQDEGLLRRDAHGNWSTPWDETTRNYTEMPLPQAVERVIARRLVHLSAEESYLVQVAAVLNADFDFRLLCEAGSFNPQTILLTLARLVRSGFLIETPLAYRFGHDKIRQVVYQAMDTSDRQTHHARIGETLENLHPEQVPNLAYHFFQGQRWEKAAYYSQLAGREAAAVYAQREAATCFSRALEAMDHLPDDPIHRFELRLARETALGLLGDRNAQIEDLTALEGWLENPAVDTPPRRTEIALRWVYYWEATSDYPKALLAAEKAVELAQTSENIDAEYQAYRNWSYLLRHQGKTTDARVRLERAYTLAQILGDASAQAESLKEMGVLAFEMGEYGPALEYAQRAIAICEPTGDSARLGPIYNLLGSIFHYTADYAAALEHNHQAVDLYRAVGNRRNEISALYNRSTILHDSGDSQSSRRTLERVCELARAIGDRRVEGYGWVFLGLVLEELGEWEASRTAYTASLKLRRDAGLHALAIDALSGLARVETAQCNHDQAVKYADEVLAWIDEHGPNGIGDACLAYKGAYRALLAAGETERGQAALGAAYRLLLSYADSISDPKRRDAYLHDIEPGRAIWNDYQRMVKRLVQLPLPRTDVPLGRPLRPEEWVTVTWTLETPLDQAIADKVEQRRVRLLRLLEEAQSQGAAPTYEHLAQALKVGLRTIERDMAALSRTHPNLPPTRRKLAG